MMVFNADQSPSATIMIPVPDQSVFDTPSFSAKKPGKKECPSPPYKSPSVGYFYGANTPVAATRTPPVDVRNLLENRFEDPVPIGKGSFGEVFQARSLVDGELYAIKKRRKPIGGKHDRETAVREVSIGFSLPPHPHCVRHYDKWEKDGFLCIQTELCKRSLKDYIAEVTERSLVIPEERLWSFLLDLVLGLKHIHAHDIIHLDIKPGNVLIGRDDYLKVADFGRAVRRHEPAEEGDSIYLPPEMVGCRHVGPAADVFSLGATLFEMTTNLNMPEGGTPAYKELRSDHIKFPETPSRSPELCDVIRRMMASNPQRRISVDEILSHPRLRQIFHSRPLAYQEAILRSAPSAQQRLSGVSPGRDDMDLDGDDFLRSSGLRGMLFRGNETSPLDEGVRRESTGTFMNAGGVIDLDEDSHGSEEAELLGWPHTPIASKTSGLSKRVLTMFDDDEAQ